MTTLQFEQLATAQQRICLLTEGSFLAERHTAHHDLMLYELHGFYAEVAFVKNTNKVAYFKVFEGMDGTEPYLAQIDISALLQEVFF